MSIGDIRTVESEDKGLDVDSAFKVSLLLEGDGGSGLQWRPAGGGGKEEALTFVAEPVEPESEESVDLMGFLKEQGARIPSLPIPTPSPDLIKQQALVASFQEQTSLSPISSLGEAATASLLAVRGELERVERRVKKREKTLRGVRQKEWEDFLAAVDLLEGREKREGGREGRSN